MNKRSVHTLVLVVTLGWAAQIVAEKDDSSPEPVKVERASEPASVRVAPATIPNRLLSIGRLLLNPNDRRQPVPLFGYLVDYSKGISDGYLNKEMVDTLIREAEAGRVRLAIVTPPSAQAHYYKGQGIVKPDLLAGIMDGAEKDTLDDHLLALTRPLSGIDAAGEFIGDSSLWFLPTQSSSPQNASDETE